MVQAQTPQTTPHIVPVQSALTTQHRDFFAQPRKPHYHRAGPTRHEAADPPAVRHHDRPSDQRFEDEPHRPGQRRGRLGGRVRQAPKADLQPPDLRLEVQQLVKAGRADSRGSMGPPASLHGGVQGRRRGPATQRRRGRRGRGGHVGHQRCGTARRRRVGRRRWRREGGSGRAKPFARRCRCKITFVEKYTLIS